MLEIREEQPFGPEIAELIEASDAYSMSLYPAEGRHPVDLEFLASPTVRLFVARLEERAVGCGALVVIGDGTAELKRMVVLTHARGVGVGRSLLNDIERAALTQNINAIRLETGPLNREAISLYKRNGYRERGPFGSYQAGPHSVFMEKFLPLHATGSDE
jgi:putative acetyltransferase